MANALFETNFNPSSNDKVPFEEIDFVDNPVSLYAATKKTNELMAYTYSHLYNIPATGLRFFTVYGPMGRPDMAYFKFVDMFFNDEKITINSSQYILNHHDFLHVLNNKLDSININELLYIICFISILLEL